LPTRNSSVLGNVFIPGPEYFFPDSERKILGKPEIPEVELPIAQTHENSAMAFCMGALKAMLYNKPVDFFRICEWQHTVATF
jgi:hypothetical protein